MSESSESQESKRNAIEEIALECCAFSREEMPFVCGKWFLMSGEVGMGRAENGKPKKEVLRFQRRDIASSFSLALFLSDSLTHSLGARETKRILNLGWVWKSECGKVRQNFTGKCMSNEENRFLII